MKIRIKDSSIRLRLTQDEVQTLGSEGCTMSTCQIAADNTLQYMISTDSVDGVSVTMKYGIINVKVNDAIISKFLLKEEVGFEAKVNNGQENGLYILVEKDFQCLIPRADEDEATLFPNPNLK